MKKRRTRQSIVKQLDVAQTAMLDYQIEREEIKLKAAEPVMVAVKLTRAELALLVEALDSHVYWQLSDEENRDSGFVTYDEGEEPEEITEANALHDRFEALLITEFPPEPEETP